MMPKINLPIRFIKSGAHFLYFLTLGLISLQILSGDISLTAIMQIISGLIFTIVIFLRFVYPKLQSSKPVIKILALAPAVLFIYLLIFSTGGLSSQFLILSHFFSISLAFLMSPDVSVAFILSTVIVTVKNLLTDPSAKSFLAETPLVSFLYFMAYIILVPFSYILAREYKFKEEWAKVLEEQIATSKTQEDELMKNINESVIALDTKLKITYMNKKAVDFSKYSNQIIGKEIFKYFAFSDKEGLLLKDYSLPFKQILNSKVPQKLENIQVQAKEKKYIRIDLGIFPLIQNEEPIGLILVISDRSQQEAVAKRSVDTSTLALNRFQLFLNSQKTKISELTSSQEYIKKDIQSYNTLLEHLSEDFIYALKIESGGIGAISSLVDLGQIAQDVIKLETEKANFFGLTLKADVKVIQNKPVQPISELQIPKGTPIFTPTFIIGNQLWIEDSIKKILQFSYRISAKSSQILIAIERDDQLTKLKISLTSSKIRNNLEANELFKKFYGKLKNITELASTTGLEGYIAMSLLDLMGANIETEVSANSTLTFTIIFKTTVSPVKA